ncbi:MAG: flagellar biosynthetic protein FliR [Deltaproteobacteria bacterium]|nr:flagellar biosynthetic protein FliR [Deltaproteobacteria bacterium]
MTFSEGEIGAAIATLARAGGLVATAPVIGDPGVPMRARLIFVLAVVLGVAPNRPIVAYADLPATALVELAAGLLTGLTARFVMSRVAVAGQLMGMSLGLGFASQYDPRAGESAGTLRSIAMALAGLAFLSAGGLESIVRATAAAPAHPAELGLLVPELLRAGTAAFGHGLALAAPIVLSSLVANVGLAVMNRAAPAVNVFSISLGVVMILGGVVLLATSTSFVGNLVAAAQAAIAVIWT